MDKLEKLLFKISAKDRKYLLDTIQQIISKKSSLEIKKIKSSDFYRVRRGRYRIIFHYEDDEAIIDSIRLRNEDTYKKL